MKPGNSRRVMMLLICTVFGFSFQTMYAQQVDTVPRKDKTDTSAISGAPAPMTYYDLYSGTPVDIYYDTVRYVTLNRKTRMPVDYYVINNEDTVEGVTGLIVNNMLIKSPEGKYKLDPNKVVIMGDELRVMNPEGRHVYWTPHGLVVRDWSGTGMPATGDVQQKGQIKQKGDAKKGKMKGDWGTIKWKKNDWKYEQQQQYQQNQQRQQNQQNQQPQQQQQQQRDQQQ
jgi:hypothetical protein